MRALHQLCELAISALSECCELSLTSGHFFEVVFPALDLLAELPLAVGPLRQFALAGRCELGELASAALGEVGEFSFTFCQLGQFTFSALGVLRQFPFATLRQLGELLFSVVGELGELAGSLGQLCELAITALDEPLEFAFAVGPLRQFALAGRCELGELASALLELGELDSLSVARWSGRVRDSLSLGELAFAVVGEPGELAGSLGQLCELAITALDERCQLELALGQLALAGRCELGELVRALGARRARVHVLSARPVHVRDPPSAR